MEQSKFACYINPFAWSITGLVSLLAFIAWGQMYEWQISNISGFMLFPLLGLLAFSIMWAHYVVAAVRQYLQAPKASIKTYFEVTSLLVLALILLHPAILGWKLQQTGFGLPPSSFQEYAGPSYFFVVLGVLSLLIFLAYELRRKYQDRSWWRYVQYASDAAMLLAFIHSIQLGSHLQSGWFKVIWLLYGVTYLATLAYMYGSKLQKRG